ncbi:ABC transporter substrate-binding protein [Planococcus faecalis]|uniref:ABC transporter substrate-binding protein n=1 Tax=Planococcus faecalis TaxID=1598147 RepID=A0ABM6IS37_9BACL|nr:ABC transporter substrate-binding protein [Planococcus faecalis]AQU79390.1 ABC transporter substrate-binding protein [Planococcus faecalis]OHX51261.1 ABC transporter substrate-binding protein [Planococcus faecalis]
MKKFFYGSATVCLVTVLAACGSDESGTDSKAGIAGEGVSGTLDFYTSQPDADAQGLVDAFKAQNPDVNVSIFRSGTEEVVSKIQAENQGGNIQADVLLVADSVTFESFKADDLLLNYKSPETESLDQSLVDPDGTYAGTKIMATGLIVNTNDVTELPTSWTDLTDEPTSGQAVMPSPLYSGAAAYNLGVMTRQDSLGWEFYEALQDNDITITQGNGAVLESVATGEKKYGIIVDFLAARAKNDGSPVELVYPEEGVPVITEPVGILANTENEEASKAFVDFILSEEGQKLASQQGYTPIREGIDAPEGLKTLDEMTILDAEAVELLETRSDDKTKFGKIFGQ